MKQTVAVIGAGVAGLSVAFELIERSERSSHPVEVVCFEASDRAGGTLRSVREGGFLCEWGANGFLGGAPASITLVRRLGLAKRLVQAREEASRRYVWRKGKLRLVPTRLAAFLRSDLLSPRGRLRALCEPLIRARRSGAAESIHEFAARRLGSEAASVLADALVSGIHAGDARHLSLDATFPTLRAMEVEHGSLIRAQLARRVEAGDGRPAGDLAPAGSLVSLTDGMQELTDALASAIGPRLRLRCPVSRLSDLGNRGVRVHLAQGAPIDFDAAVLACPAEPAAAILSDMDPELSRATAAIPSVPLVLVHLGFRREAIPQADGFGFLVPRGQGARILGTLWASNIFPARAPERCLLATVMIGGAHDPRAVELDDRRLIKIVRNDLRTIVAIETQPYFTKILRHRAGIPQYDLGHPERLATIDRRLDEHLGLWLAGNAFRGISVNSAIEQAPALSESILEYLSRRVVSAASGRPRPG